MPKPQVGEGWNTKQGNLICNCFIIYVSEDPLVISIFVSSIYQMHPRTFIQPQTPNIYLMNIQPTTLLCFSLINFCSSQGTRCSASLASCGLRLNVIEAHVRAASQSSYHVSCHPLGRTGKKTHADKIAVAFPRVHYPLEVGLQTRPACWWDRSCSPHGWPAWYLIWFIPRKKVQWIRSPGHIYLNWYVCPFWRDICRPHILG